VHAALHTGFQLVQRSQPDIARLGHQLGRRRGRGRAQVGAEIGNGEIGLVPHAADQRHRALHNGARQLLVVEGPQVFQEPPPRTSKITSIGGSPARGCKARA
jgi:hypothetical protein